MGQLRAQFAAQGMIQVEDTTQGTEEGTEGGKKMIFKLKEEPEVAVVVKPEPKTEVAAGTGNQATTSDKVQSQMIKKVEQQADAGSTGSDDIINISSKKSSKKKNRKSKALKR